MFSLELLDKISGATNLTCHLHFSKYQSRKCTLMETILVSLLPIIISCSINASKRLAKTQLNQVQRKFFEY